MSMEDTASAARRSVLPRYYQLKEIIRDKIRQQEWQPGTAIPSERELVGLYGMSRMTVRQALTELANEGVLHREQGKGTFVSQYLHPQSLIRLSGFTELIEAQGQQPTTQVLSAQMWPADKRVAQSLCIRPGLPVFRLHRLRFANGKPLALELAHISFIGCEQLLEDDLEKHSLYRLLEAKYGLLLLKAEQEITVGLLGDEESYYLNLPIGSPAHFTRSTAYTERDQPIEYAISVYCSSSLKVMRHNRFGSATPYFDQTG